MPHAILMDVNSRRHDTEKTGSCPTSKFDMRWGKSPMRYKISFSKYRQQPEKSHVDCSIKRTATENVISSKGHWRHNKWFVNGFRVEQIWICVGADGAWLAGAFSCHRVGWVESHKLKCLRKLTLRLLKTDKTLWLKLASFIIEMEKISRFGPNQWGKA